MNKGKIILLEGVDGAGKNTQAELLCKNLNSSEIPSEIMSFPRYNTPSGRIIGQCCLGKENLFAEYSWRGDLNWFEDFAKTDFWTSSLYYAGDRREALPEIMEILFSGRNLILDRWVESNMAHQGGKIYDEIERGIFLQRLDLLEYGFLGLPRPDLTFFLDLPISIARAKKFSQIGNLDAHEKNLTHLENSRQVYHQLAKMYKWNVVNCASDEKTQRGIGDISQEIFGKVIEFLKV